MRDLEIRGAGNLLGSEQSGHVAAVGFELYCRMLDEAVEAASPDEGGDTWEPVRLDVPVDAYVPAEYIPYEVAKIDLHRRIAAAREPADLQALREELEDRFGPVPEPVESLLRLQEARIKLGRAGARTAELRGDRLVIAPVELDSSQAKALRSELGEVLYESLKRTLRIGIGDEESSEAERLRAVLQGRRCPRTREDGARRGGIGGGGRRYSSAAGRPPPMPVWRDSMRIGDRLSRTGILAIVGVIVVVVAIAGILSSFGGVDDKKDVAKIEDVELDLEADVQPLVSGRLQAAAAGPEEGKAAAPRWTAHRARR